MTETNMIAMGRRVIVRCRDAGVHVGTLQSQNGREVWLQNASRIWRWRGANTLHELASKGCDRKAHTRISERVSDILLLEASEIIPVAADVNLDPVWKS